jgi:hypothetical protein
MVGQAVNPFIIQSIFKGRSENQTGLFVLIAKTIDGLD